MRALCPSLIPFVVLVASCGGNTHSFVDAASETAEAGDGHVCMSNADCDDHTACTQDLCLVGGMCSNQPIAGACDGGMCVSGMGCVASGAMCHASSDCNDNIACTMDACLVDGTCSHTANNNLCPVGQSCVAATGCMSVCSTSADCNDNIDCTIDTCEASGQCLHTAQNNRCTAPQVCNTMMGCVMPSSCETNAQCDDGMYCNGMETCSPELACVAGTPVNCDDGNACTIDACSNTMMMCTHTMDPSCSMMVHSGIYTITPTVSYSCAGGGYNLSIMMLQFTISGGTLTVNGTPAPMTSPAPTGTTFDVMGINSGTCDEHYQLMGMFTDATHFTGTLTVSFTDGGTGFCLDCTTQTFTVMGTGM